MDYNIGNKIKELRVALGLTQEQLGEMVGVKKAAINKYEKGSVKNIKRTMQIELAKALQVKPFELFYGDSATTDMLTEEITNKLELLTEEQKEKVSTYIDGLIRLANIENEVLEKINDNAPNIKTAL